MQQSQQQQNSVNNKPPPTIHHPSQLQNHMTSHLSSTNAILNQSLSNNNGQHGLQHMQMPPAGMYDHLHPNQHLTNMNNMSGMTNMSGMNMNGLNASMQKGPSAEQYIYLGNHGHQPHMGLPAQTQQQYMPPRNNVSFLQPNES